MTIETGFLSDPLTQSALIPLVLGFVLTGLLRFTNGRERGPHVAGASVALTFIISYLLIIGVPPLPPVAAAQKLAYAVTAGLVIGFVIDYRRLPAIFRWVAFGLGMAVVLYWLGADKLLRADTWVLLGVIAVYLGTIVAEWRIETGRQRELEPSVKIFIASLATAGIAHFGDSTSLAQLSGALAAALGGFMLWNWPVHRYAHGGALLLGAGGALASIIYVLVLYTPEANKIALALVLLVFFADLAAKRVSLGERAFGRSLRPIVLGLACLLPAVIAVVIAYFMADTGGADPY